MLQNIDHDNVVFRALIEIVQIIYEFIESALDLYIVDLEYIVQFGNKNNKIVNAVKMNH